MTIEWTIEIKDGVEYRTSEYSSDWGTGKDWEGNDKPYLLKMSKPVDSDMIEYTITVPDGSLPYKGCCVGQSDWDFAALMTIHKAIDLWVNY